MQSSRGPALFALALALGGCSLVLDYPPTAAEVCGNGVDDDLDGPTDCADDACAGAVPRTTRPPARTAATTTTTRSPTSRLRAAGRSRTSSSRPAGTVGAAATGLVVVRCVGRETLDPAVAGIVPYELVIRPR